MLYEFIFHESEHIRYFFGIDITTRGANDVSRVRVQLRSSRVVNISSRAYSSRARLDSLTFRVELKLELSRVLTEF